MITETLTSLDSSIIVREHTAPWSRAMFARLYQHAVMKQTAAECARIADVERALSDINQEPGT